MYHYRKYIVGYGRLLLQQLHSMRQMNRMKLWVNRHDQPIVKEVVDSVDYLEKFVVNDRWFFFFLTAEYEANGRPDEIEVEAEVEVDRRGESTFKIEVSSVYYFSRYGAKIVIKVHFPVNVWLCCNVFPLGSVGHKSDSKQRSIRCINQWRS